MWIPLLAAALLVQIAPAQEPVPGQPLAIPSGEAHEAALAADDARAKALRQYRMGFLAVRSWSELRATTVYSDVGYGYGYGSPYGGFGTGVSIATPMLWSEERWSVYRGPQRLNNTQYLDVIGADAERDGLERRIRKNRTVAGAFYGLAVAGGAATVTSLLAMDNAERPGTWRTWRRVGMGGIGGLFVGAVAGSFPTGRARRLSSDPTAVRDWEPLQTEILDHNDALRRELGLTADDALRAEGAR